MSPKDKRVVVVESLLCPTDFRECMARVLFKHFEVRKCLRTWVYRIHSDNVMELVGLLKRQ